jgi:hypothetical protein
MISGLHCSSAQSDLDHQLESTIRVSLQGHGCFSGYIMTQYVLFLLQSGKLSTKMSAGQILRITLDNLSKYSHKWI